MNSYLLICVAVMVIFTYLPRMLPLTFFRKEVTSPFVRSLLYYVPYAVLAAMTFPSIFYSTGNIYSSVVGCVVAMYFAYKDKGLVFVAIAAMVSAYLVGMFV
ncbi:MAG: AzlD domain-containing protein [Coprobacillus sp.]